MIDATYEFVTESEIIQSLVNLHAYTTKLVDQGIAPKEDLDIIYKKIMEIVNKIETA